MDTNTLFVGYINRIPVLKNFLTVYIQESISSGPIRSAQTLAQQYHVALNTHIPDASKRILTKNPCIVVFNHPYEIETFISAASLPSRRDMRMVATASILEIIPSFHSIIVPVWIDHHAQAEKVHKLSGRIAKILSLRPKVAAHVAHKRNVQSIRNAAKFVDSGGMIMLAPEGYRGKHGVWFSGIGHLLTQIKNQNRCYYVSCHIRGTSNWDWFRVIPIVNRLFPPIHIYFSEPQNIREVVKKSQNPKILAKILEAEYRDWSSVLIR